MATHSSILAWKIPWTEEPGGLLSTGSQRVRHDGGDLAHTSPSPHQRPPFPSVSFTATLTLFTWGSSSPRTFGCMRAGAVSSLVHHSVRRQTTAFRGGCYCPFLQGRPLSLRDVKWCVSGHTAWKKWSWSGRSFQNWPHNCTACLLRVGHSHEVDPSLPPYARWVLRTYLFSEMWGKILKSL